MGVIFEGKLENETVHYVLVKHWIAELPSMLLFCIFYVFPLALLSIGSFSLPNQITFSLLWIGASFYFAFLGLFLLIHWFNQYFDLFVLTNKRLIDITQIRFLVRKTTVTELSSVQHAKYKQHGLLDTVLNIGHVEVLTAGANPDLVMEEMQNPAEVTDLILKHAREYKSKVDIEMKEQTKH